MMDDVSKAPGRISIEKGRVYEIYKALVSEKKGDSESRPFTTMKDIFMYAVCLGFIRGERRPLSTREQPIPLTVLSEQVDVPILKAIALATTENVSILLNPAEIVNIAEEYANVGIYDLYEAAIGNELDMPLWNMVEALR